MIGIGGTIDEQVVREQAMRNRTGDGESLGADGGEGVAGDIDALGVFQRDARSERTLARVSEDSVIADVAVVKGVARDGQAPAVFPNDKGILWRS